jgi:hypothetical protein
VWINSPDRIFIARDGVSERIQLDLTETDVRDLVERMLRSTGRRVDLSSPFVDASLPDGSRLHVAIPDITRTHWAVNIRKFRTGMRDLRELVRLGSCRHRRPSSCTPRSGRGSTSSCPARRNRAKPQLRNTAPRCSQSGPRLLRFGYEWK